MSSFIVRALWMSLLASTPLRAGMAPMGDDPLMQVPASQVDTKLDSTNMTVESQAAFQQFDANQPKVGDGAPPFILRNLAGEKITLSDFKGKRPVLLVFGSASCFIFRRVAMPQMKTLMETTAAAGDPSQGPLEILLVYTLEAHPAIDPSPYTAAQWTSEFNVQDHVLVRQPEGDLAHRHEIAAAMVGRYNIDPHKVVIDEMDNAIWQAFGSLPNSLFLMDREGKVVFKERWAFQTSNAIKKEPAVLDAIRDVLSH